jgi:phosphoglycolate phosphatase-like HAD superfamily hydrolase
MDIAALLFDFDGTLVESMDVKVAAFRDLYLPFGEAVAEAAVAHYREHSGVPRSVRIVACHERLLGRTPSKREIDVLSAQFGAMVEDQVVAAAWVPGARDLLEAHADALPIFIVSATPQDELERIVDRRGMAGYFADILGSPPDKLALIHDLISTFWWDPERVVMVGDGCADLDAATANGVGFIGRRLPGQPSPFPAGTRVVDDLAAVAAILAGADVPDR